MIRTVAAVCPLCGPDFPRRKIAEGHDFEYDTVPDNFTVTECGACHLRLLDPRPVDEELAALYPPEYEPYHFDQLPGLVRRGRDLVQRRKVSALAAVVPANARIVDIGCGGGALLRLLKKYGPSTWTLAGWDFPGPHLDRLEADGFEVIRGNIGPGLLPNESVDVFILNQVIEHVPRPAEVIAALSAQLRPDGVMYIETPNVRGLDAQWFGGRYWGGYHFPRHLVLFHEEGLTTLLQREGLKVVETRSLASPAFWIQSFHHAVSERPFLKAMAPLFTLKNPFAVALAAAADLVRAPFAPTSNLRVIAKKTGVTV
jgi:SAM-dependent methyltransferase